MIRLDKIRKLYRSQKLLIVRSSSNNSDINLEKLEKDTVVSDKLCESFEDWLLNYL